MCTPSKGNEDKKCPVQDDLQKGQMTNMRNAKGSTSLIRALVHVKDKSQNGNIFVNTYITNMTEFHCNVFLQTIILRKLPYYVVYSMIFQYPKNMTK